MSSASGIAQKAYDDICTAVDLASQLVDTGINKRLEKIAAIVMQWSGYLPFVDVQRKSLLEKISQISRNQATVHRGSIEKIQSVLDLVSSTQPILRCVFLDKHDKPLSALALFLTSSQEQKEFFKKQVSFEDTQKIDIGGVVFSKEILQERDLEYPEEIRFKKHFYAFFEIVSTILSAATDWADNWIVINAEGKGDIEPNKTAKNSAFSKEMCRALKLLETSLNQWSGFLSFDAKFRDCMDQFIQRFEKRAQRWNDPADEVTEAKQCFFRMKEVFESVPKDNYLHVRYLDKDDCLITCRIYSENERGHTIWDYLQKISDGSHSLSGHFSYLEIGSFDQEGAFIIRSNARIPGDVAQILMKKDSQPDFERLFGEWEFRFRRRTPGVVSFMTLNGIYVELLSYYSEPIRKMLGLDKYKESITRTIDFQEHSYSTFEEIIRILLWNEAARINWENFQELLSFSNFLQILKVKDACIRWLDMEQNQPYWSQRISARALELLQSSVNFNSERLAEIVWEGCLRNAVASSVKFAEIKPILELVHSATDPIYHRIVQECLNQAKQFIRDPLPLLEILDIVCCQRQNRLAEPIALTYDAFIQLCVERLKSIQVEDPIIEKILHFVTREDLERGLAVDSTTAKQLKDLHEFAKGKLTEMLPEDNLQRFLEALKRRFDIIAKGRYEELRKNCEQRVVEYLIKHPATASSFSSIPLSSLCLKGTTLSEEAIGLIVGAFPSLIALDLSGCSQVTGKCLERVSPYLTSLNLSDCKEFGDHGLNYLKRFIRLSNLNLARCVNLKGKGFNELASTLKVLSLEGCEEFRLRNLVDLASLSLEELNLNLCSEDNATLGKLFCKIAPSLKRLHVRGCLTLLDAIKCLENLKFVDVSGCTNLQIESLPTSLKEVVIEGRTIRRQDQFVHLSPLFLKELIIEIRDPDIDPWELITNLQNSQDSLLVLDIKLHRVFTIEQIQELQRRFKKAKILLMPQ